MIDSRLSPPVQTDSAPPEPRQWLGYLLNQTGWRFRTETAHALEAVGLAPVSLRLLGLIAADQPVTQQQLIRRSGLDRTSMARQLEALVQGGLVTREAPSWDRRLNLLALTETGAARLRQGTATAGSVEDRLTAMLSADERRLLTGLLARLHGGHANICPDPDTPDQPEETAA